MPGTSAEIPGITLAQAMSILLIEDLLKPLLPASFLESLQINFNQAQAQAKLQTLPQDQGKAGWQGKILYVRPSLPMLPPKIDAVVLDTVQQALLNDRQIEIHYQGNIDDASKKKTLHPFCLVQRTPST